MTPDIIPDYTRIESIDDDVDITISDNEGNVSRLATAADYEVFQLGCAAAKASLYDEVEQRWLVNPEGAAA